MEHVEVGRIERVDQSDLRIRGCGQVTQVYGDDFFFYLSFEVSDAGHDVVVQALLHKCLINCHFVVVCCCCCLIIYSLMGHL